jgi:flagellar motility protein MotE (MotC chaperone)
MERDLDRREQDMAKEKVYMDQTVARNEAILDEQKNLREDFQKTQDALKSERVEQLVAAFKGMKPEQAGALINSLDDTVAVAILSAMPGSSAGKILAMVNPDKAARIIKAIADQKVDPKALLENTQYELPQPQQ